MSSKPLIASCLVLALMVGGGAACAASSPPVGISVGAQLWNPLQPAADTPTSLIDATAGISGAMNSAWETARQRLMSDVPKALSEFDLGGGFRLYNVKFTVNQFGPITLASVTPTSLQLRWTLPATHMSLLLRTPKGIPGSLDPGFSATVDLDLTVTFAISDTPGQTLSVSTVRVAVPPGGFRFQGDNPTGDIPVALASFGAELVTGKSLNALLNLLLDDQNFANGKQNALAAYSPALARIDLAALANQQLVAVNQAIKVPAAYVHIGQWLKPSGGGQMLSLVFSPRSLPLPPQTATVLGAVNFSAGTPTAPTPLPAACAPAQFASPVVQVQTGPRPVLDVAPYRYGAVPLQTLNAKLQFRSAVPDPKSRRCDYQLNGLVAGWPNQVAFAKPATAKPSPYAPNLGRYWNLAPQGWSSPLVPGAAAAVAANRVVPAGARFDLLATLEMVGGPAVGAINSAVMKPLPANPGDPSTRSATPAAADAKAKLAVDKSAAQSGQIKQIPWASVAPAGQANTAGKAAAAGMNEVKAP